MYKNLIVAALSAVAFGQSTPSLTAALSGNSNLTQLATLLQAQPALVAALSNATNVTILAPSNNALATLLNTTAGQSLATNPGAIQALLQYHVLNGTYYASQIKNTTTFYPTLLTNTTYANVTGGQRVEGISNNGTVTFYGGLFNNVSVTTPNVNFTGGTIHVVNRVLSIPPKASEALLDAKLSATYGALNQTNLLNTVDGLANVTIFAPNNSAFSNIGSALGNLSTTDLAGILQYHVVTGAGLLPYYSTRLSNTTLTTLGGKNITIRQSGSSVFVNGAKVIVPDVLIAGGVVHVIDQILNPNNATANSTGSSGAAAFSGASSVTSVPYTSGVPSASTSLAAGPTNAVAGGGSSSSSSKAAAAPMKTGFIEAAALFGAGAVFLNM